MEEPEGTTKDQWELELQVLVEPRLSLSAGQRAGYFLSGSYFPTLSNETAGRDVELFSQFIGVEPENQTLNWVSVQEYRLETLQPHPHCDDDDT